MAFLGQPFSSAIRQLKVIILFEARFQFWPFHLKSKYFKNLFFIFNIFLGIFCSLLCKFVIFTPLFIYQVFGFLESLLYCKLYSQ